MIDPTELSTWKRTVDLAAMAASFGYERDPRKSTAQTSIMRAGDRKIAVSKGDDQNHVWIDCKTLEAGSVIDFLKRETGEGWREICDRLRSWEGGTSKPTSFFPTVQTPSKAPPNRDKAAAVWNSALWQQFPVYLLLRGIRAALCDGRFHDTYRVTKSRSVVFPHHDQHGLCGLEFRNLDGKFFMKGTTKGIWNSNNLETASTVLLCESPIDCMAHCELYGDDTGYCAIAGNPSTNQKTLIIELIESAIVRRQHVVCGFDNDLGGNQICALIEGLVGFRLDRLRPIGKDFCDDLAYCREER